MAVIITLEPTAGSRPSLSIAIGISTPMKAASSKFSSIASNWRSREHAEQFLDRYQIPVLEGIDTRALVRHLRTRGVMRGVVSSLDIPADKLIEKAREGAKWVIPQGGEAGPDKIGIAPLRVKTYYEPRGPHAPTRVITHADERWLHCDIKSVSLLGNVLAKQAARESGAYEAWLIDGNGQITEGASTNAWIVTPEGELITRQTDNGILAGITRQTLKALAGKLQLKLVERTFTLAEARRAKEAFITSATSFVTPVVKIDGETVGDGKPGPAAKRLREEYIRFASAGEAVT